MPDLCDRPIGASGAAMTGLLVQEWIATHGGSENVFYALADAFPDADLLTLWNDRGQRSDGRPIRETWLASTPIRRHKALALPLMAPTWRFVRGRHEWALASSHAFAHHVRAITPAGVPAIKLAYVHTPARYLWVPDLDARGAPRLARAAAAQLKSVDRRRASELAGVAVNSNFVRLRVEDTWNTSAVVIHPPVDVERVRRAATSPRLVDREIRTLDALPAEFILGASRFVRYKALDDVISVGEATGLSVVLAGSGPDGPRLRAAAAAATVPVHLVESPSDDLLGALYQRAMLYVFPALEDFGIMPVEAMAVGTPVLALDAGGVCDSVIERASGARIRSFADRADVVDGVERALRLPATAIKSNADRFAHDRFVSEIRAWVAGHVGGRI